MPVLVLLAGPAIYLQGNTIYERVVYGALPRSHLAGVVMLLGLMPVGFAADLLVMGWLTTAVVLVVSCWEARLIRVGRRPSGA